MNETIDKQGGGQRLSPWLESAAFTLVLLVAATGGSALSRDWASAGALYGEILVPLLAGVLWLLAVYFGRARRVSPAAAVALGSVLGAYAISLVTSVDPFLSLVYSFPILGLLFVYFAGMWAPGRLSSVALALVTFGVILAIATLAVVWVEFAERLAFVETVSGAPLLDLSLLPRGSALSPHPNVDAMMLLVPSGMGLGLLAWSRGAIRVFAALAVVTIGIGVVVTGSRGALVGILAEILFAAVLTAVQRNRRRMHAWTVPQVAALSSVGVLVLAASLLPTFGGRGFGRTAIWQAVLELVRQRPWTGWGSGSLAMLLASRFEDPTLFHPAMWHAHNTYLELLASVGFLGVVGVATGLGLAWRFRTRRSAELSTGAIGLRIGAGAGIFGVAVHGLVESAQLYPGVLLLVGLAAATYVRAGQRDMGSLATSPRLRMSVVAVVGVSVLLGAWLMSAPASARNAVEQGSGGDWRRAVSSLESGRRLPNIDSFTSQLLAVSEFMSGREVQAAHWSQVAISEQPLEWTRWMVAAQVAAADGNSEAAHSATLTALSLGGWSSPSGLVTALSLIDPDSPLWSQVARELIREYPAAITSEFWMSLKIPEETKEAVILSASARGSSCSLSIVLGLGGSGDAGFDRLVEAGCLADAEQGADGNPSRGAFDNAAEASAHFYSAVRIGDVAAAHSIAQTLSGFPTSPLARRVIGIDAMLQGDAQAAAESWSVAAVLGDLESVNLLLEQLPVDSNAAKLVALLGESIVSRRDPAAIIDGERVPSRLRHWWSLETYAPVFLQGPLLPGATDGVEGRQVVLFGELSRGVLGSH